MRWRIVVKTESPICIARRHATVGLPVETLLYIPGSALRGTVAQAWLRQKGANTASSQEFQSVFTGGGVRWGNLYPAGGEKISYPMPFSAQTCKWSDGFRTDDSSTDDSSTEVRHGVWDILLWQSVREKTNQRVGVEKCPHCQAPLDDVNGFYRYGQYGLARVKSKTRLLARTAIMETTETAKGAMLFMLEVIEELQEFAGFLEVPDGVVGINYLQQFLTSGKTFRIGSAKTRGLGAIIVDTVTPYPNNYLNLDSLPDRLKKFQQTAQSVGLDANRFWFALTLYSDVVLTDVYGRFRSVIDTPMLELEARFWGGAHRFPSSLRHELSFAATHTVSGWNMADGWRLPKYDMIAISKGSTFLFSVATQDETAVTLCLEKLEAEELGDRKQEGFGQVIVSSPFHTTPEGGRE